ncbi:hypothetical protein [Kitasatospora sp. NPDC056184]
MTTKTVPLRTANSSHDDGRRHVARGTDDPPLHARFRATANNPQQTKEIR